MRYMGTRPHLGRSDYIDATLRRRVSLGFLVFMLIFFGLIYVAVLMMETYVHDWNRSIRRFKDLYASEDLLPKQMRKFNIETCGLAR